jgi:hypothetical protein
MIEARYVPAEGDPSHMRAYGLRWRANEWRELDDSNPDHQIEVPVPKKYLDANGNEFTRTTLERIPISEFAKGSSSFEVREKGKILETAEAKRRRANTSPQTAEEYQAYALRWISSATEPEEMRERWRRESKMRDALGAADAIAEEVFMHFQMRVEELELMQE